MVEVDQVHVEEDLKVLYLEGQVLVGLWILVQLEMYPDLLVHFIFKDAFFQNRIVFLFGYADHQRHRRLEHGQQGSGQNRYDTEAPFKRIDQLAQTEDELRGKVLCSNKDKGFLKQDGLYDVDQILWAKQLDDAVIEGLVRIILDLSLRSGYAEIDLGLFHQHGLYHRLPWCKYLSKEVLDASQIDLNFFVSQFVGDLDLQELLDQRPHSVEDLDVIK